MLPTQAQTLVMLETSTDKLDGVDARVVDVLNLRAISRRRSARPHPWPERHRLVRILKCARWNVSHILASWTRMSWLSQLCPEGCFDLARVGFASIKITLSIRRSAKLFVQRASCY